MLERGPGAAVATDPADSSGTTLRDYVDIARRRRWIILQALVLVPAAAVAFSLTQTKLYQATRRYSFHDRTLPRPSRARRTPASISIRTGWRRLKSTWPACRRWRGACCDGRDWQTAPSGK